MTEEQVANDEIQYPVLDHGFISLQGLLGSDLRIVNAARVSYLGESKGAEKDKKLLFYLMAHKHTSPFEFAQFHLHVKCPIFVARQWFRHRTWSYNEVSRRYTERDIEFYVPDVWRRQAAANKQSSEGEIGHQAAMTDALKDVISLSLSNYNYALMSGVCREQARMMLPVNLYTEFVASVNAHNLMHFLKLRMAPDAQWEIREYARAIFEKVFVPSLPWTAEAFEKFVLRKEEMDA